MSDALQFAGEIIVGLFVLGGVVHTSRTSRKASDRATTVAEKAEAANLLDTLWPRLDRLEAEHDRLLQERDKDRQAIGRLERRLEDYVRRYRAAVRYIVELQRFISLHLPGGPSAPEPPQDLLFDLEDPGREPTPWPPRTGA